MVWPAVGARYRDLFASVAAGASTATIGGAGVVPAERIVRESQLVGSTRG
jgi:hypothetical protein